MSATEAQLVANRANALQSTGPRSPEGKSRASSNATRHGILSAKLLLPGESDQDLRTLRQGVLERLRPIDDFELAIVERVVACAWRLRRVHEAEAEYYQQMCATHDEQMSPSHVLMMNMEFEGVSAAEKLLRYETTLERSMYRAIAELRKLRAERDEAEFPNEAVSPDAPPPTDALQADAARDQADPPRADDVVLPNEADSGASRPGLPADVSEAGPVLPNEANRPSPATDAPIAQGASGAESAP